jgi:hypothetical protein
MLSAIHDVRMPDRISVVRDYMYMQGASYGDGSSNETLDDSLPNILASVGAAYVYQLESLTKSQKPPKNTGDLIYH